MESVPNPRGGSESLRDLEQRRGISQSSGELWRREKEIYRQTERERGREREREKGGRRMMVLIFIVGKGKEIEFPVKRREKQRSRLKALRNPNYY
ncbi:hypothetical protein TIFTF001_010501 [Ficus carica]|uniref:Uncharacterized protein n=1 Tax=Ficus carica TaxID=3494 RepID=A0AA88D232_FICCA|nr:hypothetical protein TIFTF001_010501 [Ficus carica]